MANTKHTALTRASIILLAVIALVGGYFAANLGKPKYDVRKFTGRVLEFRDSSIVLRGVYAADVVLPKNLLIQRDIEFRVDPATSFVKIATALPSEVEVAKNGGTFNLRHLASTTQPSSLEEMKAFTMSGPYFSIDAESIENMIGADRPILKTITYRPAIFSGRDTAPESE